jgi:ABC-type sugar transport system substrate-binding protein
VAVGEKNMALTVQSIQDISVTVDMIKDLIQVINGIASQTNLLAMNAAIEAAHAGEFGKGFGVVADEIRKLAETTAQNTKNIGQNLSAIIKSIQQAVELTQKTDTSIKTMTGGIQEVSQSMREIIDSMKEMSAGTVEMTQSLSQLVMITNDVKHSTQQIEKEAEKIDTSMDSVMVLSSSTNQVTKEITDSMENINIGINNSNTLGAQNFEFIEIMKRSIERFTIIDISNLRSADNQPLIQWDAKQKTIPKRPDNPSSYPKEDARHWYDMEYAGWNSEKVNIPLSPADGIAGRKILLLQACGHPYHIAYRKGAQQIADAYQVNLSWMDGDYSPEIQGKQVKEALSMKPDLIIVTPISVSHSTEWFKKINKAGIPVIASNTTPEEEGFSYILGWTGPDDWGQFRLLAKDFAERMNFEGNYAVFRHLEGNSNFYSRTYSIVTELKHIAPSMNCLEMQSAVEYEDMKKLTAEWINKYGSSLHGLISSEPGDGVKGMCDAVRESGRQDMILVSAGNSLATQDLIKAGSLQAITYQSAEADGALAMKMAVDWFDGLSIPPVQYLPKQLITKRTVENFYPTQW